MAYIVRENDFAIFELVNAGTDEVIALGSHPQDLCELAINLLPCEEVSCLAEVLPGGVRRTIQPLSDVAREALRRRELLAVSFNGEPFGDIEVPKKRASDPLANKPELRKMREELFGF